MIHLRLSHLRSSLVNLPPILASQLSSQRILPQSLGIELKLTGLSNSKESVQALYVGWSGLTTSPNDERLPNPPKTASRYPSHHRSQSTNRKSIEFTESVELDEALATEMGWKENDRLTIKFYHHGLVHANSVNVEPLTVDDWEVLESNPQYLEDNILKQTRVLVESQKLFIWLFDKSLIQVRVESILPPPSNTKADRNPTLYLITNQTEIIVSPKTRFDSSTQVSAQKTQTLGGNRALPKCAFPLESKKIDLKILPQAFSIDLGTNHSSINPSTGAGPQDVEPGPDGDESPIPMVGVHPLQFSQLESIFPTTLCSLALRLRPNQASNLKSNPSTASTLPEPSNRHGPTKVSKSIKKQTPHSSLAMPNMASRVRLLPNPEIPFNFIYLPQTFKQNWFSSPSVSLDSRSSFRLGRAGDHEYVRLGPSQDVPDDTKQSDLDQVIPSAHYDLPDKKSEDILLFGFADHLNFCKSYLQTSLATGRLFNLGRFKPRNHALTGLLVCGSSGSGKTSLVKTLIDRAYLDPKMMLYPRYIDCSKHVDDRLSILKSNFTEWFDDAAWHSPSLLVLDDLDQLLPAEAEHVDSFRHRHFAEEFLSTANAATKDKLVIVIATCSSSATIHDLLRSGTHLFAETLELKGLSRQSRKEILDELIKLKAAKSGLDVSRIKPEAISSEKTEGYLPADLKDLVDRAVHQALIRSIKTSLREPSAVISLELEDFESAQSGFVPVSLRDVKLQKSSVNWSDIGGLAETRRILRETLEWPTKYPSVFANCPLRLRSGLLLYGYPGCGKTLLASAIAKECGLNFITIKGPELLNKYIGASEQSVRDLFERAQVAKPCVLFFDEFESIAPKRGHDSTGVTDRVVNQLLTQMDGAEGLEGVYVLAATSRPDLIDPALLRPGRLDKSLLCSMPTAEERHDILKAVSRSLPLDGDLRFDEVAELTEGFTGADLQALIYSAHLEVVHESIHSKTNLIEEANRVHTNGMGHHSHKISWTEIQPDQLGCLVTEGVTKSQAENEAMRKRLEQVLANATRAPRSSEGLDPSTPSTETPTLGPIELRHIRSALRNARPSVPPKELARLSKIYRNFVSSRSDGGLPGGEASEEIGGRASLM